MSHRLRALDMLNRMSGDYDKRAVPELPGPPDASVPTRDEALFFLLHGRKHDADIPEPKLKRIVADKLARTALHRELAAQAMKAWYPQRGVEVSGRVSAVRAELEGVHGSATYLADFMEELDREFG